MARLAPERDRRAKRASRPFVRLFQPRQQVLDLTLYCEGFRTTMENAENVLGLTLFVPHYSPEKTGVKGGPTVGVCLFV